MTPALDIQGVTKRFGSFEALRGISLQVEPGEFFGLLGPNGAGKTTLISILSGLARATTGTVRVAGHDVVDDYAMARRKLGVVPQELVFDPFFTVRETLRLTAGYYGIRRDDAWIDELLANLGLSDKADTNTRALSGGMKRRVLVAQALVHRPQVIVLDEPTAGVDVELRHTLWVFIRRLNREGHTIVLTTHYLEEAQELCQRIAMMRAGRIVSLDRTENLLRSSAAGTLVLRLSGAPLPAALDGLQLPVVGDDPRVRLRLDDYNALESVLAQLRSAGCRIDDMELQRTDLEDVFVQTMQAAGNASAMQQGQAEQTTPAAPIVDKAPVGRNGQ